MTIRTRCLMCLRLDVVAIPRLSEGLPASRLIRARAPMGQILHGLLWLCWRVLPKEIKRHRIVRLIYHERGGLLHDFAEYLDLAQGLSAQHRAWLMESMQHQAQKLERILARARAAAERGEG